MANNNTRHTHSHRMHIYSPRKQPKQFGFNFKKKEKEKESKHELVFNSPSIILHPFGNDPNQNNILISKSGTKEIISTKEENPNKLKSKSTLKKPKNKKKKKQIKQSLYSRSNSKKKLNLKPSDSDTTNISTSFKESYHQKQRNIKKRNRKFGMDKHNRVLSFTPNDLSIPSSPSSPNSPSSSPTSPPLQQKSMSVSPKDFTRRTTPVYNTNYSDSLMKIDQKNHIKTIHDKNGRKTSIRKFTNNHRRQRSKFEPVITENNDHEEIENDKEEEKEQQRTSASFTTDDLDDIPKFKKGDRVLCRPSGDKDEKWRAGTIQEIMEIDNKKYLSIMAEIDSNKNNKDELPTFAQYYIPLIDKTRVRPLYYNKEHNNDKNENNDKDDKNKTKIMITEHVKDGNNNNDINNRSSRNAKSHLRLKNSRSNPSYTNSQFFSLGIGGVFTDYDINYVDIKNNKLYYKNEHILTPNINKKPLNDWSSLEVSSWLLSIENTKYSIYIPAMIENNVNGKALYQLQFVTMLKLTRYQINVTDCNLLLMSGNNDHNENNGNGHNRLRSNTADAYLPRPNHTTSSRKSGIKYMINNDSNHNKSSANYRKLMMNNNPKNRISRSKIKHGQFDSGTSSISSIHDHPNELRLISHMDVSDDIDIPLFKSSIDNNSNEIMIEHGRFWRLFYFPKDKMIQYEVDKKVSQWSSYEVSLYIQDVYNQKFNKYSPYFIQHQIDGESLLNITREQASNQLKMISPGIRRLFFDELRALSTLQPCNIRQNNHNNYHSPSVSNHTDNNNNNDVINIDDVNSTKQAMRRLTRRFTKHEHELHKVGILSPRKSASVDRQSVGSGDNINNNINTDTTKSNSLSPRNVLTGTDPRSRTNSNGTIITTTTTTDNQPIDDDIMVAQKIVSGLHKQVQSSNNIVVANIKRRNSNTQILEFINKNSDKLMPKQVQITENGHKPDISTSLNKRPLDPLISSQEDDDYKDDINIVKKYENMTKEEMDFHNEDMTYIAYSDDDQDAYITDNKPRKGSINSTNNNTINTMISTSTATTTTVPSATVGALFSSSHPKHLIHSDPNPDDPYNKNVKIAQTGLISQGSNDYNINNNIERPLSIEMANIEQRLRSLGSDLTGGALSNVNVTIDPKMTEMKDSRQSSYNTDATLSPSVKGMKSNGGHLTDNKHSRPSTLIILTSHENKHKLLVQESYESQPPQTTTTDGDSSKRSSERSNNTIHESYKQYTKQGNQNQYGRYSNSENSNYSLSVNKNKRKNSNDNDNPHYHGFDEQEVLEIDVWDTRTHPNDNNDNDEHKLHLEFNSYSPNYDDDDNDPLFNESLSPASTINNKYTKKIKIGQGQGHGNYNNTLTSTSFAFDAEEKMNELNDAEQIHEPNLTLDLDADASATTAETDQTAYTLTTNHTDHDQNNQNDFYN